KICDFIGEDYAESMLDTGSSAKMISTRNETWKRQVSDPLDPTRLFRWKRELSDSERGLSSAICRKWLLQFGYEAQSSTLCEYQAWGLDTGKIDESLEWLYVEGGQGRVYLRSTDELHPDVMFFLVDSSDISRWKS